jgi:hypothetical protein
MPEKTTRKFWASTKDAGFAAVNNAMMNASAKLPAGNFRLSVLSGLIACEACWNLLGTALPRRNENPKSCRPATFRRTKSKAALPDARSSPGPAHFGNWLCLLCAKHFARPLILKGTHFLDKESRPPKRPPE